MKKLLFITIALLAFCYANEAKAGIIVRPVIHSGLVGYWDFQEGAGSVANDHSGNSNHGTLTNMDENDWVDGKLGKGLDFDGSDDHINFNSSLNLLYPFTFCCHFYPRDFTNPQSLMDVAKSSVNDQRDLLYFRPDLAGDPVQAFTNSGGTGWASAETTNGVSSSGWHYACGVWTAANNRSVYLDGGNVGTNTVDSASPTGKDRFRIGIRSQLSGDLPFDGLIDEVRVYNRALSAKEIERLYNLSRPKIVTPSNKGLVGYWRFDEGTGTKLGDHSGNGNHGTLQNMEEGDWVDGKYGKALEFDGSDEYVDVGDINQNGYVFSFWAYFPNIITSATNCSGLIKYGPNVTQDFICLGACSALAVDETLMIMSNDAGWERTYIKDNINAGWHYITFNWNGSRYDIYLDNDLKTIYTSAEGDALLANVSDLDIAEGGSTYSHFNGLIDEVRIYNRALSASEIQTVYKSGLAKINSSQTKKLTDGLVGMWSFDGPDMAGNTAFDRSGQGNHGTLAGGPERVIGKVGQGLGFDGVDDYVDAGDVYNGVKTAAFWIKADGTDDTTYFDGQLDEVRFYNKVLSADEIKRLYRLGSYPDPALSSSRPTSKILDLNGTANIEVSSGTITANGFTDPSIYVNASATSTIDDEWRFVVVTTGTGIDASAATLGKVAASWTCGVDSVTFTYKGEEVTYGTVVSETTPSECWLDRNLGASTGNPTASDDHNGYGDLFQWGRFDHDHQSITWTSSTEGTPDNGTTDINADNPENALFITEADAPYDWRVNPDDTLWSGLTGENNPCPSGWRIPTGTEWNTERESWATNDAAGAFGSPLQLTTAGYRKYSDGSLNSAGSHGLYWSSTVSGTDARLLYFHGSDAFVLCAHRASGFCVRCLKD